MARADEITIGSKVVITDNGATFERYDSAAAIMSLQRWCKNILPAEGHSATVVNCTPHPEFFNPMLYAVRLSSGDEFIMEDSGLELAQHHIPLQFI